MFEKGIAATFGGFPAWCTTIQKKDASRKASFCHLFTLFLHPLNRLFVGGREPPMTGGGSDDHLLRGADTVYNRHDGSGRTGLVVVTEGVEAGHFDQFGKVHYIVVG